MDFNTYAPLALRTAKMREHAALDLEHAALGLITELGEFTTNVKRVAIYSCKCDHDMRANMFEELGDTMWYVPLALHAMKIEPSVAVSLSQSVGVRSIEQGIVGLTMDCAASAGRLCAVALRFKGDWQERISGSNQVQHDANLINTYYREYVLPQAAALLQKLDALSRASGFVPDAVRSANIDKLRKRYPDAYSDAAAEARADKTEGG